jgi:hypothetical protein
MTLSRHMYVDESKRDGYLMVGVVIDAAHVNAVRTTMKSLLLPGQERIHFKSESDNRRRFILGVMRTTHFVAFVAKAMAATDEHSGRQLCLKALLQAGQSCKVRRLCIEQEVASRRRDELTLREFNGSRSTSSAVSYTWLAARQEPLLWIADALAWTVTRGGQWYELVSGNVHWAEGV